jgi:hypothetical protein
MGSRPLSVMWKMISLSVTDSSEMTDKFASPLVATIREIESSVMLDLRHDQGRYQPRRADRRVGEVSLA